MKKNGKYVFAVIVALAAISLAAGFFSGNTKNRKNVSAEINETEFFDNADFESDYENNGSVSLLKIIDYIFGNSSSDEKNVKVKSGFYISAIYITGMISEENRTYNQKWLLKTIDGLKMTQTTRA